MFVRVHHVQLTVKPEIQAACREFYGNVLGLKEIDKPAALSKNGGTWFTDGSIEVHVSIEPHADNLSSRRHICYVVENLEEAKMRFQSAGVQVIPDQQPIDGWLRFYVRDPGGNRVEISQLVQLAAP